MKLPPRNQVAHQLHSKQHPAHGENTVSGTQYDDNPDGPHHGGQHPYPAQNVEPLETLDASTEDVEDHPQAPAHADDPQQIGKFRLFDVHKPAI